MITEGFGLALSGGGVRAAAFHCGVLQALSDLNLVDDIKVVSTVSGGSVFGAAWLAAKSGGKSNDVFLKEIKEELVKGAIGRSIRPGIIKLLLPGYTRSDLIAGTFNRFYFRDKTLADLPEVPKLCINTTILNNGQVGKFSREGFSAWGLHSKNNKPPHLAGIKNFPLALAVTASAAFPVGLPPVRLKRKIFPTDIEFRGDLKGAKAIYLTDGGVLENLGIQTLLKSHRFSTWHMVVSDAGTKGKIWKRRFIINSLRSFLVWLLSGRTLDRIMLIMNSKENRWARQRVIEEIESSRLAHAIQKGNSNSSVKALSSKWGKQGRRNVLFVRVNQKWSKLISSIPRYRLIELGASNSDLEKMKNVADRERFLRKKLVNLDLAKEYYKELGGDDKVDKLNEIATNFTGLSPEIVESLACHAMWQIHATHSIYWPSKKGEEDQARN